MINFTKILKYKEIAMKKNNFSINFIFIDRKRIMMKKKKKKYLSQIAIKINYF